MSPRPPCIELQERGVNTMQLINTLNNFLWGPATLILLLGTGLFLTVRTRFLPWRNLGWALRAALGRDARATTQTGDVSSFSALMTALAATIGTGNIVGVATALTAGGPGALIWMELSAAVGLSTKFTECLLAVKYRRVNARGEMSGGPMYVLRDALGMERTGALFALFAAVAAFGIGCMTQSNSIAEALSFSFGVSPALCGAVTALLALAVILGGVGRISAVSSVVVPVMAVLYMAAGTAVILGNLPALPAALSTMLRSAFSPEAAAGGAAGSAVSSMLNAARWGIARGVFSNEAGLGSAAISAAAASTDSPARQGYISMTGTFFDTIVICTVTGLAICCSGALDSGAEGAALTILAFRSVLGEAGGAFISLSVALFAFATIIGWEYQGEKAFEYLCGTRCVLAYRILFAAAAFWGAVQQVEVVFRLSDICNALMCLPNLLCLLLLSGTAAQEALNYQRVIHPKGWNKL